MALCAGNTGFWIKDIKKGCESNISSNDSEFPYCPSCLSMLHRSQNRTCNGISLYKVNNRSNVHNSAAVERVRERPLLDGGQKFGKK